MKELSGAYEPKQVEQKIYRLWEKSGYFNPDRLPKKLGPRKLGSYSIVIPPPNITGSLHIGHALNSTTQDILIRWQRMRGYKALWLPGTDHAGIATQNVVEKELKKEGKTRHDLGRERFLKRVWEWRKKYGDIILDQLKQLGASCDWSRTRFTMDPDYVKAVEAAFSHYFKKGWIYRGERVINWCPRCNTSLSDLELEYKEEKGKLWYIKYPLKQKTNHKSQITNPEPETPSASRYGAGKSQNTNSKFKIPNHIVVATTRPETMLGDAAVAVNQKDERYKNLIGEILVLPIKNRGIPIIADRLVEAGFGTGAVKITPCHDIADFEISQRHNLPRYQVIDENGRMTIEAGDNYKGLSTLECRQKVVVELEKQGYLEKIEDYPHRVSKCYRCENTVEPLLSRQWFLKMDKLAKLAMMAVKKGEITFHPKRWEKLYFDWLKDTRDWCVSRQLWWGHRIPIWYCGNPKSLPEHKMGFHKDVVPRVFKGKTKTYRLRNHNFEVGDKVVFENSQTKTYFGYGIITDAEEIKVKKIDYKDKTHYKTYRNLKELIAAFKLRNPDKKVTPESKAYLYEYKFHPFDKNDAKRGCGQIIISACKPKQCPACKGAKLQQDPDVLDTWFSSALWPFATLGWPPSSKKKASLAPSGRAPKTDLQKFYPTQVLSTDRGIINLWVGRMVFSSYEFLGVRPFTNIYIHATVLTREGKRMSKSLGTGIDPLELIKKYGADATRFGLMWQAMGGQDIRFVEEHFLTGKKFCNKLWNASRFVMGQTARLKVKSPAPKGRGSPNEVGRQELKINNEKLSTKDRDFLKKLGQVIEDTDKDLEKFRFGQALHRLYDFFWHEFCDKYIEHTKKHKNRETEEKLLLYGLMTSLKLLHPFIPFVTEEIYQKLPMKDKKLLLIENWPRT